MESTMLLKPVRTVERTNPMIMVSRPQEKPIDVPYEEMESRPIVIPEKPFRSSFIEANTQSVSMEHLMNESIVPVFSKDNEVTISHPGFIETVQKAACDFFRGELVEKPQVRVSHVIKGRTPEAIHKSVPELLDREKTIYYERMAFAFEIPTINTVVDGNRLNLTVGGVRAYNHENLYSKKSAEKFKVFVGFKNLVCTNLCVTTDGYKSEIRAMSVQDLYKAVIQMFQHYNPDSHLFQMHALQERFMSEHQFAQFLGKSRLYQCLPFEKKRLLPEMLMTDTQINLVAKSFYNCENFGMLNDSKEISMWKVYNLLTGANKSSYIDNFLDRTINATQLADGISKALMGENEYSWFVG